MNKNEFLFELRKGLSALPENDVEERLFFYSEMIDDYIEEGLSEDEAVSKIGPVGTLIDQIISETPLPKLVREKVRKKRRLRAFEIVLLILGSPLWLSLLVAAFAVILAFYVALWSVIISLWSVEAALAACSAGLMASGAVFAIQGQEITALALLGCGILCLGLSIFLFFGCRGATKGIILLTKKAALGTKKLFTRKENEK